MNRKLNRFQLWMDANDNTFRFILVVATIIAGYAIIIGVCE